MPSIAIIGASSDRSKFGNKAVRAYASRGYDVYPIHPKAQQVEGLPAYASIREAPVSHLDQVSIYLPPAAVGPVLDDLAGRSIGTIWLNPGTDSPEVLHKARQLGLNVVRGCSIVAIGVDPSDLP